MIWCDFGATDGYYGVFSDVGEAQSPVSSCDDL